MERTFNRRPTIVAPFAALALALLASLVAASAHADGELPLPSVASEEAPQKPKEPFAKVTNATMQWGPNEGGASGRIGFTFEFKGDDRHNILPSQLTVAGVGGLSSHLTLDASITPIEVYTRRLGSRQSPDQPRLSLVIHPVEMAVDSNLLVEHAGQSNIAAVFSAPLALELGASSGRVQAVGSIFAGPATGFLCTTAGCSLVPPFTPLVGAQVTARVGLNAIYSLEGAASAAYLISTDPRQLGPGNFKGEAHGYLIRRTSSKYELYTGIQGMLDDKDIRRVDEGSPKLDRNYSIYGVVGVNFGGPGQTVAR